MLKSPTPLRTKRNFKALQLPELDLDAAQKPAEPLPTRPAPQPGRRRPPPIQADPGLGSPLTAGTPGSGRTRSAIQASLTNHLARLDIMGSPRFDLKNEDLTSLQELGHGNGGSVVKVHHVPTSTIMAKKVSARASFKAEMVTNLAPSDRPYRRQTSRSQTDSQRTPNPPRVQFSLHRLVLWRIFGGSQHLHMHGVYG